MNYTVGRSAMWPRQELQKVGRQGAIGARNFDHIGKEESRHRRERRKRIDVSHSPETGSEEQSDAPRTQSQFSSDATAHIKSMSFSMSRCQSFLLASATAPGPALFKAIDTVTELDSTLHGHLLPRTVHSNVSMIFGVHQHNYQVSSISIRGLPPPFLCRVR